jgi:predicted Fe-Mo cluster-binding NifX family protein
VTASRSVASPGHGEGCNMPAFVQSLGASAVIVGGIGGGAVNGLAMRGIEVIAGASGNAGGVLKSYAAGTLISGEPGCHGHGGGGGHSQGCGHHHDH